nr:hypothetical protein [Tanacetum cinerariifolium]
SPDYSPAFETDSDPSEDPASGHIPPLPAISPFLSSDDDTTDTPGQPISHGRPYRYHPNRPVMAISVISISSNSSEDSMGTPARRVILFGTIPTTIPDTTPVIAPPTTETSIIALTIPPASPDYSPAFETDSDPSEDPASGHIPPLPAISPFLSSDDDTTDSDTPDTPPS